MYLRQEVDPEERIPRRVSVVRYDLASIDPPLGERRSIRLRAPIVIYDPDGRRHVPIAGETIDLAKGVPLGELRRRIEAFAAKA